MLNIKNSQEDEELKECTFKPQTKIIGNDLAASEV